MKKLALQIKSWIGAVSKASRLQHAFVQAFCASWFITLAAQIKVPFYPVPMTIEDWAIMLVALLATRRAVVGAVLLFLAYGVVGLPVLSSGATGLSMFLGPTAGYLVGFILMGVAIASLNERYPASSFWPRLGFVLLGNVLLFGLGVGFLAHLIGWKMAFQAGLLPFVWIQPTKAALAACLSVYLSKWQKLGKNAGIE